MKLTKYVAIVEVNMDSKEVDEINSWVDGREWDKNITPESYLESVIKGYLADKGYIVKAKVYQNNMYERLNENADDYILRDAREEIENEILNSKMCVGGNCED